MEEDYEDYESGDEEELNPERIPAEGMDHVPITR